MALRPANEARNATDGVGKELEAVIELAIGKGLRSVTIEMDPFDPRLNAVQKLGYTVIPNFGMSGSKFLDIDDEPDTVTISW